MGIKCVVGDAESKLQMGVGHQQTIYVRASVNAELAQ